MQFSIIHPILTPLTWLVKKIIRDAWFNRKIPRDVWLESPLRRPLSYVIQWHLLLCVKLFWSLRAENEFIVNSFQQVKITLLVLNLNLWRTIHLLRFNSEVIAKGVCILALQWKQCVKATENQSLIFDLLGHRCHNLYFVLLYFLVIKTVRQECRICLAINLIVIILVLEVSRRHRDRKSNFRKNKRITDTLKKLLRYDAIHFSSWHNSFLKLINNFSWFSLFTPYM